MSLEKLLLEYVLPCILSAWIECRFLTRVLGAKYPFPLTWGAMIAGDVLFSGLNMTLGLVGTISGHFLYYCFLFFLLYAFLFRGSLLKKLFFDVILWCSLRASEMIFFPVWMMHQWNYRYSFVINMMGLGIMAVLLEIFGRKFQNLRRDLPKDFILYLLALDSFVFAATHIALEILHIFVTTYPQYVFKTMILCTLFAIWGLFMIFFSIYFMDRQVTLRLAEQQYALQASHWKLREEEQRKLRGMRHDIKNHLSCLEHLLRSGKTGQALTYMGKLAETMEDSEISVNTGNDFADALLNDKYQEALAKGIKMTVNASLPPRSTIDPVDLCCILGNALDNAIEAAGKTENPWIALRGFVQQGQLILEIKNSALPAGPQKTPECLPIQRGIGLENVQNAICRYGGVLDLAFLPEGFVFSAMLPAEQE